MTFRLRLVAAALAGAFAAFGQEPYAVPLALLAGMAAVAWLWRAQDTPRRAALLGWVFGTGYFLHALQWIVSPFLVDVARHGWMAPFALVLTAGGMALFWGAAFWGARRLGATPLALVLTWPAAELVRAYLFTGFPWASPAQALVDALGGQVLAWIGPHGLNVVLVLLAVAPAILLRSGRYGPAALGLLPLVVLLAPLQVPPSPAAGAATLRLVQPNAPQHEKWDPEKVPVFFDRQLQFTAAPARDGGPRPDLVIWSETAIPWRLDMAETALSRIADAAAGARVTLGVQRAEDLRYFNSMVVLDDAGGVAQLYDKHHLVPFGEFMPLGDLLAGVGIHGLAARDGNGYSSGPGPKLLDFGPLGRALPLICYEAVFAQDVNAAPARPDFLVQITNDAWFGRGAGPRQHLAQARMRAIEQGLPLARAANTGISAMIDPRGRVIAALPLNTAGFVDAALPVPLPATPYSRTGDLPLALLLLAALCAAALRRRSISD